MKFKKGASVIDDLINNVTNELLLVGCIFKKPDLIIESGYGVRSKYDFYDPVTRFFFDNAEIIYKTRSQDFNQSIVTSYMAENSERLNLYKKYGGWKTIENWMQLAEIDSYQNYFNILKKYSLLREYQKNGFNVDKIYNHPKFEMFTAMDIYRMIRGKIDRTRTVILTNEETVVLNKDIKETLIDCMETPDMGLQIPFPVINDAIRGLKQQSVMAVGMLSNAGKSRFMVKLIAYITLVMKEKVLVLLNEMTVKEIKYALITTVINNKEFQEIHGIKLHKTEHEFTLGLYKDRNGDFIYREKDEWGDPTEEFEDYIKRVSKNSQEFNQIMKIAEWVEKETEGLILVKDVSTAYDDKTLEFEIKKANLTQGVNYFFYDTFKNDISTTGDWAAMKVSATRLTEIARELNMFGYLSIQLTDDANIIKPDELTSSNIANCKAIKHVLHTLFLCKEIPKADYYKYGYIANTDWGNNSIHDLQTNKRYYCFITDKNRFGEKPKLLFEVNLDNNEWYEIGKLIRK